MTGEYVFACVVCDNEIEHGQLWLKVQVRDQVDTDNEVAAHVACLLTLSPEDADQIKGKKQSWVKSSQEAQPKKTGTLKSGDKVLLARELDTGWLVKGTVWGPNERTRKEYPGESDWGIAVKLGLTADPGPEGGSRRHVMVAWDFRPGALQVHYTDELRRA